MSVATSSMEDTKAAEPTGRFRRLGPVFQTFLLAIAISATFFSLVRAFNLTSLLGFTILDSRYYYIVLTMLLPLPFIVFPMKSGMRQDKIPWYDLILAGLAFGISAYLSLNAVQILEEGWEFIAPETMKYASLVLWMVVLEAARRTGGNVVGVIIAVVSIYPVFAGSMPGLLKGVSESLLDTAAFHIMSTESIIGVPFRAFAYLVIGFMVFGVALQHTGGGKFFIRLAFALLGRVRGGPAKVAILSSGFMGSMSGSVITNVLTTGSITIPAMIKSGIRKHVAGGIEACASTGGVLMPPVMGATAFIIAVNLGVSYREVLLAALIPSLLYFFALFIQIDTYAAKLDLKGGEDEDIESVGKVLKEGWYYLFVFALLLYLLVGLSLDSQAPYYATGLLLAINQIFSPERFSRADFLKFVEGIGRLFAELAGLLAGVGLIVGSLSYQSKIGTLAFEMLELANGQVFLLLIIGALVSFIMGIGVTVTIAYIILAISLAPALADSGLNAMAVHLFMLYWGMLSYITPPVAIGAFAASSLAGAPPTKTGFEAMRFGTIIYFIPFFFVLDPGLIMQGDPFNVLLVTGKALIGIVILSMGLQGYLYGLGKVATNSLIGPLMRVGLILGGLAMAMPGNPIMGVSNLQTILFGIVCVIVVYATAYFGYRAPNNARL